MKQARVLLAGLYHETHCFVPEVTAADKFRIERGREILERRGDGSPIDGFLEIAELHGWKIVPAINCAAAPSGRADDRVFEAFWSELESAARGALAEGLSGVFLSLHGAMATGSIEDVEGELLERLRALPGMVEMPMFGVFDLHATFTERMARHADCLVCYRNNPHTDARESSMRVAELLAHTLTVGRRPGMYRLNPPIVWPPGGTGTADTPMRELEALARDIERRNTDVWAVNVVAGFAFSDAFDAGVSFSVVTGGGPDSARRALAELQTLALQLREAGLVAECSVDEILETTRPDSSGPILLVEPADNIGGGAPGDCTGILRAFLRHRTENAAVVINDPQSVAALEAAPAGSQKEVSVGGKGYALDEGPVPLVVTLISKSDGRFELEDPHSHLASMQGRLIDMGACAVVRHEGITILLTSRKTPPFDLGQFRSQGIDPAKLSYIGVKAAVAHRQAYDPIASASYMVRTPGPCTSDPRSLPYHRLRRPIFPLDPIPMEAK